MMPPRLTSSTKPGVLKLLQVAAHHALLRVDVVEGQELHEVVTVGLLAVLHERLEGMLIPGAVAAGEVALLVELDGKDFGRADAAPVLLPANVN